MRYRHLRTLHLWLTFAAGLPLLVLSLTGALLVFGPESDLLLEADVRTVSPPSAAGTAAEPRPYSELVAAIAAQKPDLQPWSLGLRQDPAEAWSVWLAKGAGYLLIDPYRAIVLDHQGAKDSFYGTVTAIHRWWLVKGPARAWVRHLISAAALLLLVQVLVGLWLYLWPPKRLKRLAIKRGRMAVLRLHQLTGLLTGLVLMVIAFTGMAIHWNAEMKEVVEFFGGPIRETPPPAFDGLATITDLDAAVRTGRAVMPEAALLHIRLPQKPGDAIAMGLRHDDLEVPSRVWVGDAPPRVLFVDDRRDVTTAEWLWHFRYHIHYGDFAGTWLRVIWIFMSLLPAAFIGTGLWLYLRRRPRRRRSDAATATPAAGQVTFCRITLRRINLRRG